MVRRETEISDEELVGRVKAGDRAAFDKLVRPIAPRLLLLATRMLGSPADAEDAVQNALASVWLSRQRLDSSSPIRGYLTTITLNKCRDHLRRRKAASFLGFGTDIDDASILADDPASDMITSDRQDLARVQQEIGKLPIKLREALLLVVIDGRSHLEAAHLIGVSEKTIETRIYRARKRLRNALRLR